MDRKLLLGTSAFFALTIVFGLLLQVALEFAGIVSHTANSVLLYLAAMPLALLAGRRVGTLSSRSVLLASMCLALLTFAAIVALMNAIAAPTGGHFGWAQLLDGLNWRSTVFGGLATLAVPQLWLALFNRMAANNSSKPTPLRGAA